MKNKIFGFIIGKNGFPIEITETIEKKALHKLIDKYWKLISEKEVIELCGETVNIKK